MVEDSIMTTEPKAIPADVLEPCPFCGGEAKIIEGEECAYVQCADVKMHRALWFDGDNNAAGEVAEQWNRRAALEPAPKPAGGEWVTVPKKLTPQMRREFLERNSFSPAHYADASWAAMISAAPPSPAASPSGAGASFQDRVDDWLIACFGEEIARDKIERNHRFIEEALELVQSNGCTASEAHQLVDYVYGRPVGELEQEVGGVMNTLAALCLANGISMDECGETELCRVWTKVEKIRAKQAAKPKHLPLPEHVTSPEAPQASEMVRELVEALEPFAAAIIPDPDCVSGWRFGIRPKPEDFQRAFSALAKIGGANHDK